MIPFQNEELVSEAPPPRTYRPLQGRPRNVRIIERDYKRLAGDTRARNNGLRYEWRVQNALMERFGVDYIAAPGVYFDDDGGTRVVLPDGILRGNSRVCIVEIKHQHMPEAWWQLELYREVLGVKYQGQFVTVAEVVKTLDPSMPFPCRFDRIEDLADLMIYGGNFGVVLWPK